MRIYSIGHSSRELSGFIDLLKHYGIEILVDVRSYPKSSRFPHFSKEVLQESLREEGIAYLHIPELGGFRKEGYREHMKGKEFKRGISKLVELSRSKRTAIMCAEKNWRECHRRFIAEALLKRGIEVIHILDKNRAERHPAYIF